MSFFRNSLHLWDREIGAWVSISMLEDRLDSCYSFESLLRLSHGYEPVVNTGCRVRSIRDIHFSQRHTASGDQKRLFTYLQCARSWKRVSYFHFWILRMHPPPLLFPHALLPCSLLRSILHRTSAISLISTHRTITVFRVTVEMALGSDPGNVWVPRGLATW